MATTNMVQRGDAVSAVFGCTGGMSSSRCKWPWQQPFITAVMLRPCGTTLSRSQRTARAGKWVRGALHAEDPEHPPSSRPDCLADVRPQERVPRRTVEQIVDSVPVVLLLHTFVPQMADLLVKVLKILDNSLPDVEQVIEVPLIILHKVPQRSPFLEPQVVEQLVEVPRPDRVALAQGVGTVWYQVLAVGTRGVYHQPRAGYKYWAASPWSRQVPAVLADLQ